MIDIYEIFRIHRAIFEFGIQEKVHDYIVEIPECYPFHYRRNHSFYALGQNLGKYTLHFHNKKDDIKKVSLAPFIHYIEHHTIELSELLILEKNCLIIQEQIKLASC